MKKSYLLGLVLVLVITFVLDPVRANDAQNVLIKFADQATAESYAAVRQLSLKVTYDFAQIKAMAATVKDENLDALRQVPGVAVVERDAEARAHAPSYWTWDLDMLDVERVRPSGTGYDGTGVYVAVIDTGLVPNWMDYFPASSVDTDLAMSFHNPNGMPNPSGWRDVDSHGTHVSSTILGYNVYGNYNVNGVAPGVKIIPVKVLGNTGSGSYSAVAAGILYVADLKKTGRVQGPVVINMSLGGPEPSAVVEAAVNYAIRAGVVIVCSAGNEGEAGMGWPGAFRQVVSVGACGWTGEWTNIQPSWWRSTEVVEGGEVVDQLYVTAFSSRQKPGQELDVLAPGSWVVGPYLDHGAAHPPQWARCDIGQYYFLGGTSMAAPHVTGTVALMLQKNPRLTQSGVEAILRGTAWPVSAGTRMVNPGTGTPVAISWGEDATGFGLVNAEAALEAVN